MYIMVQSVIRSVLPTLLLPTQFVAKSPPGVAFVTLVMDTVPVQGLVNAPVTKGGLIALVVNNVI